MLAPQDGHWYSPLHMASEKGHTAIIIALVEEGQMDVNQKGGEKGDTPLMLSVSHHNVDSYHESNAFIQ